MYKESQRPNVTCPLIDDFHVKNILGARERRELIFGSRVTIPAGFTYKSLTLSSLSGGWVTSADHYQVLVQKLNATATIKPYVINKTSTGFDVHADISSLLSVVIKATLPAHPRSNAKDAWSYCPYCKFYGFKDIVGSTVRDISLFGGKVTTTGATAAVTFGSVGTGSAKILTATTKDLQGADSASVTQSVGGGSLKKWLVTTMEDDQYQIILTPSKYALGGSTSTYPYPSAITDSGFTLNGDTWVYDVLILGQVKN